MMQIHSRKLGGGHMYALFPTPELWSQALSTRTQIIFSSDASVIAFMLHIKSGSIVAEAGAWRLHRRNQLAAPRTHHTVVLDGVL